MDASLHRSRPVRSSAIVPADWLPIRVKCATVKNSNGVSAVFMPELPPVWSMRLQLRLGLEGGIARKWDVCLRLKQRHPCGPPQKPVHRRGRLQNRWERRHAEKASPGIHELMRLYQESSEGQFRCPAGFRKVADLVQTDG